MKTIVINYSRKGSNKYLAEKISGRLNCDIEKIKPRIDIFLLFLMKIHFGIKGIRKNLKDYDRIIMCGPIWMGRFVPPLRSFITRYTKKINRLVFVSCCGSTDEKKDEKFGHGLVFNEVKNILHEKLICCRAFPIVLVVPKEKRELSEAVMNTRLNDENFKGEILERFEAFIRELQ